MAIDPDVHGAAPVVPAPANAASDRELERFARLTRRYLGVPVALVSIVTDTEQLMPGAVGLPPELEATRRVPLSHALCLDVVSTGTPLVVPDTWADTPLADHAAVRDLDVRAYAGFPLFDVGGHVIGSLCAIDHVPHEWTRDELDSLADLAGACSSELRLRGERERARAAQRVATDAHRHSRLLLMMAEAFTAAITVTDVAQAAARVASIGLGAPLSGIALLDRDGRGLTYTSLDEYGTHGVEALRRAGIDDDRPLSYAARTLEALYFRDHEEMLNRFPGLAKAARGPVPTQGLGARAVLPLTSRGRLLGVLTIGWLHPRDFGQDNRDVKSALAGYTAQALERALLLEERRDVARTLQDSMLTALPELGHLQLAAQYLPAARTDKVGGDWYDAVRLPDGDVALMVGDVTGHDMDAAARMGQLRSMLRAFAWDRPGSPSSWLSRLDRTSEGLGLGTLATALTARIGTRPDGGLTLRWSSAGHPPIVHVRPGRDAVLLEEPTELLLGVRPTAARRDHDLDLEPGDTILLYTDGLVERRDSPLDDGLARLVHAAAARALDPPEELVQGLMDELVGGQLADDVVVLAARVLPYSPG